jgi:hypothetical protein
LPFWFGATPRSGQFMQNSCRLEYFLGLVFRSFAHHRESPGISLCILGYSNTSPDVFLLFLFGMEQSQCQGAAILGNISLPNFQFFTCYTVRVNVEFFNIFSKIKLQSTTAAVMTYIQHNDPIIGCRETRTFFYTHIPKYSSSCHLY